MSSTPRTTRIFISYARADLEHLRALETHLANLKRQGRIETWTDQVLEPGARWEPSLHEALNAADILLCLVTADFMASNFIHDVELSRSFERERLGQVRIIPVLIRPTDLKGHPLEGHQGLPRGFQPITEWQNRDRAWVEVVTGLRTVLDKPLTPHDVPQPLSAGYEPLLEGHPPSALLVARYRVVPFFQSFQASALERIHTWLEDTRPFDVLLVTGDAGSGKTRLLYEVVEGRREACWVAGLLDARRALTELKPLLEEALGIPHPLLLAVDYAETALELGTLLEWIQQRAGKRAQPVRVLLAARGSGDWWRNLSLPLNGVLRTLLKAEPVALGTDPDAARLESLAELYRESLQRFAEALGGQTPVPLSGPMLSPRPLFVLLTALAQCLGLPTAPETLLEELVHHEMQFWRSLLPDHAYEREAVLAEVHRLVAAVALRGGLRGENELHALFQRLDGIPELTRTRAQGFLSRVYPGQGPLRIRPVEPDLLAAELIRQVLVRSGSDTLLEPALADNNPDALAVAFRLLEDIGRQDEELSRRALVAVLSRCIEARALPALRAATRWKGDRPRHLIAEVLLARLKQGVSAEVLLQVNAGLPSSSLALVELAGWVTAKLRPSITGWRGWLLVILIAIPNLRFMAIIIADLFIEIGKRQSDLGLREEALYATQQAVTILRRLIEKDSNTFSSELFSYLIQLGQRLNALGRQEEALAAIEEALVLGRRLGEQSLDAFIPSLARGHKNLGIILSALGRREEALAATEEALAVYRRLAEQAPDAFIQSVARTLNNLCTNLSALGQRDEALTAIKEALAFYRRLAEQAPDAFIPYLAGSLSNQGEILCALGRQEEALAATEEAVTLSRRLAEQAPATFTHYLSNSCSNLGEVLCALGRWEDALAVTEEAVILYRRLAEQAPDAFTPDLARSLNNLGVILCKLDRRRDALVAAREAVEHLTPYFQQCPKAFHKEWVMYARNLRERCQACGIDPASDPELQQYMTWLDNIEAQLPKN